MNRKLVGLESYDDIILGCQNLEQNLEWFTYFYTKLNMTKKKNLKARYENHIIGLIIEIVEEQIKETKRLKLIEKNKELNKGENDINEN